MDLQEFPKMLYLNGDATKQKIVNSQAEEDAAGPDWLDGLIDPAEAADLATPPPAV